ncbi:MAG: metallophosphoesterase family protein, partial [Candidatus Helarchaeota archaeon]
MKKRHIYSLILTFLALGGFLGAYVFIDTSPISNSYRTSYGGTATTILQTRRAHLSNDTKNIFWFLHITDTHIGGYWFAGDNRQNLHDFLENAKHILNLSRQGFVVDTGDLTNGILPAPIHQDVRQWRDRYNILVNAQMFNASFYYDIPGNHDGYSDSSNFSYFLNWSVQQTLQYSWNRSFSFGNYTFIALNSAADDGSAWPYGTDGSLNQAELDWFEQALVNAQGSNLTFVFSHHAETQMGDNTTTPGKTFLDLIEEYKVAGHFYGHGHEKRERNQGGTIAIETDSLGMPSSVPGYRIIAVDNDGISCKYQEINTWPVVLITCPIDRGLTMQAFDIPTDMTAAPIRALVFDENTIWNVNYKIDSGPWFSMHSVPSNPVLWNGSFDASLLTDGQHRITVRANSSSGISTDSISIRVGTPDQPEIINGPIPSFSRIKDCAPWSLDLTMFEWDDTYNGTQLNWSISGVDPNLCTIELTDVVNDLLTFTPVSGAFGTDIINLTLTNGDGKSTSQTITITLVDYLTTTEFHLYLSFILIGCIAIGIFINFFLVKTSITSKQPEKKN